MDVSPPPASGLRMHELGDHLFVHFRPRRSWGTLFFLAFWLLGWTAGGVAASSQLLNANPGKAVFFLLWLCGWALGECFVVGVIAWQLFGRELLTVTPSCLEVRKGIGRFAQTNRYDAALVQSITTARVPHDDDEKPRNDFCLQVSYNDDTVRVGEGMGESEADYIASVVLSRIRGRSWWSDELEVRPSSAHQRTRTATLSAGHFLVTEPNRKSTTLLVGTLIACVTIGGTLLVVLFRSDEGTHQEASRAARSRQPPPAQRDFSNARAYVAAMTSYVLTSDRTSVLGQPNCSKHVTWTRWACRVRVRATNGPFAGRALPFRCSSVNTGGVICGPQFPRVLTAPPTAGGPNG